MKAGTTIKNKGHVPIPKPILDRMRWRIGERLTIEAQASGFVRLSAAADDPIERLFGCLRRGDPLADLEAEHRAEVAAGKRPRSRR